ncbi:hypothetical protein Syun_020415 [Stephania yunnanensis]|uniref:NAC domain-containing protein n=1 Tax=Stephania yunnanensis TaxID=152371 RepID=A0AAP0NNV5_9MAGN
MARAWVTNGKGIARKLKNATESSECQIKDCGASLECPNCHHLIDNTEVPIDWPGLPSGVKFDPTDAELLEHLARQAGLGDSKPQLFIDVFIQTLDDICYTHPENLPGAKKDGSSVHFFHSTCKAYSTGSRKRRKIHGESSSGQEDVRWHKTGKTKPVMENGVQKGCKKIMVLYKSSKKGVKPGKSKWVMHQYHLGTEENEKKQQPNLTDEVDTDSLIEESVVKAVQTSPRTPASQTPNPPRPRKRALHDVDEEETVKEEPFLQAPVLTSQAPQQPLLEAVHREGSMAVPSYFAGESQAVEDPDPNAINASLLCNEILDSYAPIGDSELRHDLYSDFGRHTNAVLEGDATTCGISDLGNLEFETPPEFDLAKWMITSKVSICFAVGIGRVKLTEFCGSNEAAEL